MTSSTCPWLGLPMQHMGASRLNTMPQPSFEHLTHTILSCVVHHVLFVCCCKSPCLVPGSPACSAAGSIVKLAEAPRLTTMCKQTFHVPQTCVLLCRGMLKAKQSSLMLMAFQTSVPSIWEKRTRRPCAMKASKQLPEKGKSGSLNSSSNNSRHQAALQERLLLMLGRSRMIGTACSQLPPEGSCRQTATTQSNSNQ